MFKSRNKKNNVYPCKPQFYYIKVGFKGVKIIQVCFLDADLLLKNVESTLVPTYICFGNDSFLHQVTNNSQKVKLSHWTMSAC